MHDLTKVETFKSKVTLGQIENAVSALSDLLKGLVGTPEPGQAEGMEETPQRFIKALFEQTQGYLESPSDILAKRFEETSSEMIIVGDIDFTSVCEHHLLPFIGTAHVAYIPDGPVVGLSKIPRLVDCFARRLQIQERMSRQIADALVENLNPLGVGVILKARHQCMSCRGVRKAGAYMITSTLRGVFMDDPQVRAEFLRLT